MTRLVSTSLPSNFLIIFVDVDNNVSVVIFSNTPPFVVSVVVVILTIVIISPLFKFNTTVLLTGFEILESPALTNVDVFVPSTILSLIAIAYVA